jgi:hypothetical protein
MRLALDGEVAADIRREKSKEDTLGYYCAAIINFSHLSF